LLLSAQISFSSRLPAAIAAPTPVSALVHFYTLVTAGVYLLIRFRPSFSYWLNDTLLLVSGLNMFIAGLGANFKFVLKRIIPLSTSRQLDLMITTISIGLSGLAFFLLLTRTLFKALLLLLLLLLLLYCVLNMYKENYEFKQICSKDVF